MLGAKITDSLCYSFRYNMLKKFSIIIIIIFLFLCFLGTLFLCHSPEDEMAKLIPKETIFYGQWKKQNIKKEIGKLENWEIKEIFQNIPCQEFLEIDFIEAEKTGIAVLLNEDKLSCLIAHHIKDKGVSSKILEEFDKKDIKYLLIKNHLVVAQEQSVIEKVKTLKDNPQLSLADVLPKEIIQCWTRLFRRPLLRSLGSLRSGLLAMTEGDEIKAYLNIPLLKNHLAEEENQTSQIILSLIEDVDTKWLVLRVETEDDRLTFNLSSKPSSFAARHNVGSLPPLETFLDNSIVSENFFMAANIDWPKKIKKSREIIPQFESKIKEWERLYDFDLQKDILPFLDQPNILLVNDLELFCLLRDCFVARLDQSQDSLLAMTEGEAKWIFLSQKNMEEKSLEKIKKIAKQILAYKLPTEKQKVLPDGSKVKELIADPSLFEFGHRLKQIETDKIEIYFLQKPEKNFEFAYGIVGGTGDVGDAGGIKNIEGIKNLLKYIPNISNIFDTSNTSNIVALSNSLKFLEKNIQNLKLIPKKQKTFYFDLGEQKMIIEDYSRKGKVDIRGIMNQESGIMSHEL